MRHSDKEFIQFLFIAMSSCAEIESHLYVALDQGYVDQTRFDGIYEQARKTAMMISGLIKYLRGRKPYPTAPPPQPKPTKPTEPTEPTESTK